jgi:hypothetical protein
MNNPLLSENQYKLSTGHYTIYPPNNNLKLKLIFHLNKFFNLIQKFGNFFIKLHFI